MHDEEGPRRYRLEDGFSHFVAVPNEVIRSTTISGNAKALYAILIDVVVFKREEPTQQDLGVLLGGGVKLARSTLKELHDAGLLEAFRPGQGHPNYYVVMRPKSTSPESRQAPKAHPPRAGSSPEGEEKSEKAPTGELVLARPKEGARKLSQTLTAYFVDESKRLHSEPPRRVTGQVARLVGEMLEEGIAPARISAGIDLLLLKRLGPSTLPSLVHEAGLPRRPQPRRDGTVTPTEIMAHAVQLAREGR